MAFPDHETPGRMLLPFMAAVKASIRAVLISIVYDER